MNCLVKHYFCGNHLDNSHILWTTVHISANLWEEDALIIFSFSYKLQKLQRFLVSLEELTGLTIFIPLLRLRRLGHFPA